MFRRLALTGATLAFVALVITSAQHAILAPTDQNLPEIKEINKMNDSVHDSLTTRQVIFKASMVPRQQRRTYVKMHPIDFDTVLIGTSAVCQLKIENTGTANLSAEIRFNVIKGPFGISSANVSVPPKEERTIQVSFSPPDESSFLAQLIVRGNDRLVIIPLSGTGRAVAEDEGSAPTTTPTPN